MVTFDPVLARSRLLPGKADQFYHSFTAVCVAIQGRILAHPRASMVFVVEQRRMASTASETVNPIESSTAAPWEMMLPPAIWAETISPIESSTAEQGILAKQPRESGLRRFLPSVRDRCDAEDFEGLDEFLTEFVSKTGADGIVEIAVAADQGEIGPLDLVEVMRLLGRWNTSEFRNARSWLMQRFLSHPSAAVRDGALIGLLLLEDSTGIPVLEKAISNEPVSELRRELVRGLEYLRSL
jgi:hypothetical protein